MKKIFAFLLIFFVAANAFALRFGVDYIPFYFEKNIMGKKNNCTLTLVPPSPDDFNSTWHTELYENDEDFFKRSTSWKICRFEDLGKISEEESKKGNLVIHYDDGLFFIGNF